MTTGSALPSLPRSVPRGRSISWLHWFASATACQVARPPVRIRLERPAFGDFYFQAFNGSVSLPVAGYNYNSDWTPLLAGLSPAGMAASLAARSFATERSSACDRSMSAVSPVATMLVASRRITLSAKSKLMHRSKQHLYSMASSARPIILLGTVRPSVRGIMVPMAVVLSAASLYLNEANCFLGAVRALSAWARPRGKIPHTLAEGVKPYPVKSGHKPWTPAQIAAIDQLDGMVRRGVLLYLYTGQRGSDVVRLGWTKIDEGGFALRQRKTGREVWCPIVPELAK